MSWEHSILGSGEPVCDCWLFHNVALYTGIFFFFLTKHIFVFTSSRDLALEKRCVVKVTHFTRVFALTKESQRTGPRLLVEKTSQSQSCCLLDWELQAGRQAVVSDAHQ